MADLFNGLMAIPNLIALFVLGGVVTRITRNYFDRKKNKNLMPMLSAYPLENAANTQEYIADGGEEGECGAALCEDTDDEKIDNSDEQNQDADNQPTDENNKTG